MPYLINHWTTEVQRDHTDLQNIFFTVGNLLMYIIISCYMLIFLDRMKHSSFPHKMYTDMF